jgi:type II secretory pathway component PulC
LHLVMGDSMDSRFTRMIPFLLITIGCIVSVELFYFMIEKFVFTEKEQPRIAREQSVEQPKDVPKKRLTPTDYSIIMKRNLFGPPPDKKVADTPLQAQVEELEVTTLELVLMGTIFGKNDEDRAIILTKKARKQDIYRVGDQIQGALIKEIRRGTIVLNVDGQDEILDMSEAGKYAPKTPARPVAANFPRRRAAVIPGMEGNEQATTTTSRVRPRVVRPTRKIISSRRRAVENVPASDGEPAEVDEEPDLNDLQQDGEPAESGEEPDIQDTTEQ